MIKILGGLAKNLSLEVAKGQTVRPTSVLLRRRVFDSWQNLNDINFIDCCAGSGGVGLEAWSRGAKNVTFVEANLQAAKIIKKNILQMKHRFSQEVANRPLEMTVRSIEQWLPVFLKDYSSWSKDQKQSTIIFFDPPYSSLALYQFFLGKFSQLNSFTGLLWVESESDVGLSLQSISSFGFLNFKTFYQGKSFIAFLKKSVDDEGQTDKESRLCF